MLPFKHFVSLLVIFLLGLPVAAASSVGFILFSPDQTLGESEIIYENGSPSIPQYSLNINKGQIFTLDALSVRYSRPKRGVPGVRSASIEADAVSWLYDDRMFSLSALPKGENREGSRLDIRLRAKSAGKTNIRFIGLIGGREIKYDIRIVITEPE